MRAVNRVLSAGAAVVSVIGAAGALAAPAGATFLPPPPKAYEAAVLHEHPLLYLPLDDRAGSHRARNLGSAGGAASVQDTTDAPSFGHDGAGPGTGAAAVFGGDSVLDAGDPSTPASFTLEAWFRTGHGHTGQLLDRDAGLANGAGPRQWQLAIGPDGGHIRFIGLFGAVDDFSTDEYIESARPVDDGRWHMVAVSLSYDARADTTTMELAIDGRPVDPVQHSGRIPARGVPFGVGGVAGSAPYGRTPFTGLMQQVALIPRALSEAQIRAQYALAFHAPS